MIRKVAMLMMVLAVAGSAPALCASEDSSVQASGVTAPAKPAKKPMRRLLMSGKKPAKKPAPAARPMLSEAEEKIKKEKKDKDKPYGWDQGKKTGWDKKDS